MKTVGNFSFLIPGQLAGSAHPGAGANLGSSLAEMQELGIGAIMTLTEHPLDSPVIREFEMDNIHIPIEDFGAPSMSQIRQAMDYIRENIAEKRAVLVHCFGGYGRTGTILACHLVREGLAADDAIEAVRRARPGSIESAVQERAIRAYAMDQGRARESKQGGHAE